MAHATTIILSLSPQILGAERSHVCVYTFSFEVIQLALRSHNGHILNTYHLFSNKYYLPFVMPDPEVPQNILVHD